MVDIVSKGSKITATHENNQSRKIDDLERSLNKINYSEYNYGDFDKSHNPAAFYIYAVNNPLSGNYYDIYFNTQKNKDRIVEYNGQFINFCQLSSDNTQTKNPIDFGNSYYEYSHSVDVVESCIKKIELTIFKETVSESEKETENYYYTLENISALTENSNLSIEEVKKFDIAYFDQTGKIKQNEIGVIHYDESDAIPTDSEIKCTKTYSLNKELIYGVEICVQEDGTEISNVTQTKGYTMYKFQENEQIKLSDAVDYCINDVLVRTTNMPLSDITQENLSAVCTTLRYLDINELGKTLSADSSVKCINPVLSTLETKEYKDENGIKTDYIQIYKSDVAFNEYQVSSDYSSLNRNNELKNQLVIPALIKDTSDIHIAYPPVDSYLIINDISGSEISNFYLPKNISSNADVWIGREENIENTIGFACLNKTDIEVEYSCATGNVRDKIFKDVLYLKDKKISKTDLSVTEYLKVVTSLNDISGDIKLEGISPVCVYNSENTIYICSNTVHKLNGLSGNVTIEGLSGITVETNSQSNKITLSSDDVHRLNNLKGEVNIIGGDNINVSEEGNNIIISADLSAGVQSLNNLSGHVKIESENICITVDESTNTITLSSLGSDGHLGYSNISGYICGGACSFKGYGYIQRESYSACTGKNIVFCADSFCSESDRLTLNMFKDGEDTDVVSFAVLNPMRIEAQGVNACGEILNSCVKMNNLNGIKFCSESLNINVVEYDQDAIINIESNLSADLSVTAPYTAIGRGDATTLDDYSYIKNYIGPNPDNPNIYIDSPLWNTCVLNIPCTMSYDDTFSILYLTARSTGISGVNSLNINLDLAKLSSALSDVLSGGGGGGCGGCGDWSEVSSTISADINEISGKVDKLSTFVRTLNGLSGDVNISANNGISASISNNTINIGLSGTASGVNTLNGLSGNVNLFPGEGITLDVNCSTKTITINSSSSGYCSVCVKAQFGEFGSLSAGSGIFGYGSIKLGNTYLSEEQLQKLLQLI